MVYRFNVPDFIYNGWKDYIIDDIKERSINCLEGREDNKFTIRAEFWYHDTPDNYSSVNALEEWQWIVTNIFKREKAIVTDIKYNDIWWELRAVLKGETLYVTFYRR